MSVYFLSQCDGVSTRRTLLGPVDELNAVLEELAGDVKDLLNLVGHCE